MVFKINRRKKKVFNSDDKNSLLGRKGPNEGDSKSEIFFAWFPKRMDDQTIIWLESYIVNYEYCRRYIRVVDNTERYISLLYDGRLYPLDYELYWEVKSIEMIRNEKE